MKRALRELVLLPIHAYRRLVSPALAPRCKYYPSCSAYAVEAVRELGILRGAVLAAWRLARCNPWTHGGVDEVADRRLFRDTPLRGERRRHGHADPEHRHGAAA
ncbi:MAG: membrane protein insertion efficiency factor YidD [Solirubrobacterales bacterium]